MYIQCKKSLKISKGGNQKPYIEEEQTTQWPKEKVQKDRQRSTKHTYKTKDRITRTPLKAYSSIIVYFLFLHVCHKREGTYSLIMLRASEDNNPIINCLQMNIACSIRLGSLSSI